MRHLVGRDRTADHAPGPELSAAAAADHDVITLDRLVLALVDLCRDQTNVADIVLGAGVGTAGQMDIDRLIERQPRVEIVDQRQPVTLRIGECEFATDIPGAGDHSATDRARRDLQAKRLDRRAGLGEPGFRDIGDQQVLPHRQPQRPGAIMLAEIGEATQLCRLQSSDRQHHADVKKTRLRLRVSSDMAVLVDRPARLACIRWPEPPDEG